MFKLFRISHLIVLLGVVTLSVLAGCGQGKPVNAMMLDKPFPPMSLVTLEGKPFPLSELQGKVVILKLWATWCSICIESEPEFKAFVAQLDQEKVKVVSLSVDSDINLVREYWLDHPNNFVQLVDIDMKQSIKILGVTSIPQAFIIDQQGVLRYSGFGRSMWGDDMRKAVERLASFVS